ncbi:MAG: L-rhamnose/proton symporter RhaT [Tannerella sp.]|jgi:L-rhamnose-H+ transport protein|nr:L-rhamnose/proton symporter RhaT [Tannerella sp.]
MNLLVALIIIAIGSFGQSSSYVPIKKIKDWSWESFWLVQGIFAWLVFPVLGSLLAVPEGGGLLDLLELRKEGGAFKSIIFGVLWGVGGLTFGLSMRYLGIALGQSLALGACSAFGTLIPALQEGENLLRGNGLILLIAVCISMVGITIIGYAGSLRSKNMSEEDRRKAVKDFALKKGLLIALLSGVMSACFALGLNSGQAIREAALSKGVNALFAGLPVVFLVTLGGFVTNATYCLYQNAKNRTFKDYVSLPANKWMNNLLFCALAGLLWYSQFFGLETGKSFMKSSPVLLAFSWCILMSLDILFSNVWGILLKEWRGVGKTTVLILVAGLLILVFSIVFPQLFAR